MTKKNVEEYKFIISANIDIWKFNIFEGGLKGNCKKKVHNGIENSENKKKYGVAENFPKKCHDLEPNGIGHNSG